MTELRPRDRGQSRIPGIARHGRLPKPSPWLFVLKIVASALAVVLVSGAAIAGVAFYNIESGITTTDIHTGEAEAPPPTIGAYPGGYNLLIVGSDTRDGQGGIGGDDGGSNLNDVTMLLHVSADHTSATAVSIPRDMVVPIPDCGNNSAMAGQPINVTLYYGGLQCTVKTVEELTGLKIQFAGLITFKGVIEMSNAVGGVNVCVTGPVNDSDTGLHLKAGTTKLKGARALAFLRTRHGVGDGSDLGRISSQQVYLSSLVRTLKSSDTLSNPTKLYSIATAATSNMTLSSNMKSVDTLVSIAQSLRTIPLERVVFVQYPSTTGVGGIYTGKVAPLQAQADSLFKLIKADKAFDLGVVTGNRGSVPDPNATASATPTAPATPTSTPTPTNTPTATSVPTATPTPTTTKVPVLDGVIGQSAADYTCSKANN
ncbi:LCP family protein [Glaciihabitans sp. dw_435]|uniref:LCP family protein n=1 Tax=Glaciihabitans sp. dw_435 TaxID=2720081 RepID=UPI002102BEFE|nr:LCP family protein [Glaciihabitans sp. dw_435]